MNQYINDVLNGKTESYRLLVRQLAPSLRSYLSGRLSDFHLVEDLSQEIFITVYQSLEKFDPKYDFRSWFFTIARNKLNSHLRKVYSKKSMKFAFEEEIQNLVAEVCDDDPQREGKLEHIQSCVAKLPEDALELIKSRYYTNETVISLAERLNSTENAISSKLFRIRKNLKDCLSAELIGHE
ncbi:sigma-70 family RNA polymerase sigma factor [Lentisphaera profundi]|uniref:Sigma-70 family RNA polymerase sigma factor n=1 Tax=Lentisphaera profundi TaxID=1658616 RepID=A0ABY7VVV0_9BACT|nr:sigma-70 family RNA polymerase sigma factor [Lentisphaera profundi]WDE98340.1 sigma-70 family RNA polymerase sigma factor [Lentisphaera profundi]